MCLKMKEGRDDETSESSVVVFRISSLLCDLHLDCDVVEAAPPEAKFHLSVIPGSVFLL